MQNKTVTLNRSQSLIHIINANVTHCLWPRGNGKTEGGGGPRIIHLSETMPRSQVIYYSDTFERIESVLIPNVMSFISNEMGLVEDEDYTIFKKPPDHWIKPLIVPRKFDRVISFATGFALCCAASFKDGSANGFNAQAAIIDEVKFVREDRIKSQLFKALRGGFKYFGHLPEYRSVWSFTDKYEGDVKWILRLRDQQNNKLINAVLSMQLEVYKLKDSIKNYTSTATIAKLRSRIFQLEKKLADIRKELIYVSDAKPFENIEILGEKYYRDAKRDCKTIFEYNVAILNQDPDQVENTFYPGLSRTRHFYKSMNDTSEHQTLIVAMDYQWRITPMAVAQRGILPDRSEETLNIVNAIHTLHPDGGIKQTVKAFCDYYINRQDKIVMYVYDHTAINRSPAGKCFKDIALEAWQDEGWIVIEIYEGKAPDHDIKHEEIKTMMQQDIFMFNEVRASHLLSSVKHAGAIISAGVTKKDKSQEKVLTNDPIEQTDYSDAFDQIAWAEKLGLLLTDSAFTGDITPG